MSAPSESEGAAVDSRARLDPADRETLFGGPISEEDLRQLERRAEREPEIARALSYLRPLDARFHQRVLDAVRRDRQPRRGSKLAAAGMVAVCAGLLVLLLPRPKQGTPSFALEVEAGWSANRSARGPSEGTTRLLEAGAPIVILARPATAFVHQLELTAFGHAVDGWRRLRGSSERSDSGVIRFRGRWPEGGTGSMTVVIGPRSLEAAPTWLDEGQPGFQIEVLTLESQAPPASANEAPLR